MDELNPTQPLTPVSGLYTRSEYVSFSTGGRRMVAETVRLDVDGWFPQMMASGTLMGGRVGFGVVDWLATDLKVKGAGVWEGRIARRWGDVQVLPHNSVRIRVPQRTFAASRPMTLTFTGGAPDVTRTLDFESPYFRTLEVEFDTVEGAPHVTSVDTWAHPERPVNLQRELLTIPEVYGRAGVGVQQSPGTSLLGLEAGVGAEKWDNQELHDAMQVFWSRYQARAQWALWVLFAHRHVDSDTGGVMFDFGSKENPDEPFQRQGAAVFGDALREFLPPGDNHPEEWIRRRQFFAAVHEIGHCFNLLHSWAKNAGETWTGGPLPHDEWASSFMNYPQRVENFFKSFDYRFDDPELVFIRHAPDEFVRMGATPAGKSNAFGVDGSAARPGLALELTVSRARPVFEFLEPVTARLRLTNISRRPLLVEASALEGFHDLTLTIQPRGGVAQKWRPYVRACTFGDVGLLQPGESLSTSLFASAGVDGWHLAEPGSYTLQASLHSLGRDILTKPLTLRVASPRSREEDDLAQDFFTDEVGRALALGGTHVMTGALDALREAASRLGDRAVARHAMLALALPLMQSRKVLRLPEGEAPMSSVAADGGCLASVEANPDEARRLLDEVLMVGCDEAAETFGHSAYRRHAKMYAGWLERCGDKDAASKVFDRLSGAADGRPGKRPAGWEEDEAH